MIKLKPCFFFFQQFGQILDVEIIFNERGSKVCLTYTAKYINWSKKNSWASYVAIKDYSYCRKHSMWKHTK